jgi:hypothetical protein
VAASVWHVSVASSQEGIGDGDEIDAERAENQRADAAEARQRAQPAAICYPLRGGGFLPEGKAKVGDRPHRLGVRHGYE